MTVPPASGGAARLVLLLHGALGAAFALLVYWQGPGFMAGFYPSWVGRFLAWHTGGYWLCWACCAWALRLWRPRRPVAFFLAGQAVFGLLWSWKPLAGGWGGGLGGVWLSLACWQPLLAWELFLLRKAPRLAWAQSPPEEERAGLLRALLAAAALVFAAFSACAVALGGVRPETPLVLLWSAALHLTSALTVYALWSVLAAASSSRRGAVRTQASLVFFVMAAGLLALIKGLVTEKLALYGWPAVLIAAAAAAGLMLAGLGQCRQSQAGPVPGVLSLLCAPVPSLPIGAAALAAMLFACAAAWMRSALDWGHLFQTLTVAAAWAGVVWLSCASPSLGAWRPGRAVAPLCLAAVWAGAALVHGGLPALTGLSVAGAVGRLETVEPSLRAARSLYAGGDDQAFYAGLRQRAHERRRRPAVARDIRLVPGFGAGLAKKPDVYLFVIDSLRQDAVGAYNPLASATPSIDAFAAESLTVRRAFTAYGGTGLSEPSLWTGAHLPHGFFPRPYAPLNSLEKLLTQEGYRRYLAPDVILRSILEPRADDVELRQETADVNRFCPAVEDLKARLAGRRRGPVFAYVQAHDVHFALLRRDKSSYQQRLKEVDACFGAFVSYLKGRGLYEESVIILTSDHGDSHGEGGRWGHSYTLYPEVLRIPLIMRLPAALRRGRRFDPEAPALLTDVTPTLYDVLGHRPERHPLLGRSLLPRVGEPVDPDSPRLLASSYGPVFGLLKDRGRGLYIADAVDRSSRYYDLEADPAGRRDLLTPSLQRENSRVLLGLLSRLDAVYP